MKPPGHPSIVLSRSQCPSESPGSLPNNFRERVGPRILLKSTARVGAWWYTLVIPATWEAEAEGSRFKASLGKVSQTLSQKYSQHCGSHL
jgi:hypothetical protein